MKGETPILSIRGLRVRRSGSIILNIEKLDVARGETISLIGPNGAGKSTLLKTLLRLEPAEAGDVYLDGGPSMGVPAHLYRRNFALVFQDPLLLNDSVLGNVMSGLLIRGMARREARERACAELDRFRIADLAGRRARTLSGGEAQRASLARALATGPAILLLDEPFGSLDAPTRESLMDDLESVLRESGTTAIIATHDRNEALRMSGRIVVLDAGRVIQDASTYSVLYRPANEFVASFAGTDTILEGRVAGAARGSFQVAVDGGEITVAGEAASGTKVCLCIRPESVVLSAHEKRKSSERNSFRGKVERILRMGHYYKVVVDCGFTLTSYITIESCDAMGLHPGKGVRASFKATAVHVIKKSG